MDQNLGGPKIEHAKCIVHSDTPIERHAISREMLAGHRDVLLMRTQFRQQAEYCTVIQ